MVTSGGFPNLPSTRTRASKPKSPIQTTPRAYLISGSIKEEHIRHFATSIKVTPQVVGQLIETTPVSGFDNPHGQTPFLWPMIMAGIMVKDPCHVDDHPCEPQVKGFSIIAHIRLTNIEGHKNSNATVH